MMFLKKKSLQNYMKDVILKKKKYNNKKPCFTNYLTLSFDSYVTIFRLIST